MATIIAVANQKGGVGKTTSTYNIAAELARRGLRTLMIDLDPQASLTLAVGKEPYDSEASITDGINDPKTDLANLCQPVAAHLSIITSKLELATTERALGATMSREFALKKFLTQGKNDFDYILIDCPPQLSLLTINALVASRWVLMPCKTDYLSFRGLDMIADTIAEIQDLLNPELEILGTIATMYEKRVKDDREILEAIQDKFALLGKVKKAVLVKNAVYDGATVYDTDPRSEAAIAYTSITDALIKTTQEVR